MITKNNRYGFSLIELSIVILIVSVLFASSLTIFNKKSAADKNRETRVKLERIAEAIKLYYRTNNLLPCPALLDETINSATFGYRSGTAGTCPAVSGGTSGTLTSGTVPIIDLGLPPEYMFDSWGNRIVYILDTRFNNDRTAWPSTLGTFTSGGIRIENKTGGLLTKRNLYRTELAPAGTLTDCLAAPHNTTDYSVSDLAECPIMLLISHGSNGLHSFNKGGVGPKDSTFGLSTAEAANASVTHGSYTLNTTFVDAEINQDMKNFNFTNYFDDILVYKPTSYFTP